MIRADDDTSAERLELKNVLSGPDRYLDGHKVTESVSSHNALITEIRSNQILYRVSVGGSMHLWTPLIKFNAGSSGPSDNNTGELGTASNFERGTCVVWCAGYGGVRLTCLQVGELG